MLVAAAHDDEARSMVNGAKLEDADLPDADDPARLDEEAEEAAGPPDRRRRGPEKMQP